MHVKSFWVLTYLEYTFGGRPLSFVTKKLMMNYCKKKRNGSAFVCSQQLLQLQILLHFDHLAPSYTVKEYFSSTFKGYCVIIH